MTFAGFGRPRGLDPHRHGGAVHAIAARRRAGQGQSVAAALARTQAVVEGVNTARTAVALGERHGVELPISREVANVLVPEQAAASGRERPDGARAEGGTLMSSSTPAQPVQEFFSIGEVCQLTDLKPHVLRYWESQFRFLNSRQEPLG